MSGVGVFRVQVEVQVSARRFAGQHAGHGLQAVPGTPLVGGLYGEAIILDADSQWPNSAAGSRDRITGQNETAPLGNFYDSGRNAAPETPGPCVDSEANGDEIDADEANTYQVRSRNDPVRVITGSMERQRDMDRYLREEVLEAEEREWWGRHEI